MTINTDLRKCSISAVTSSTTLELKVSDRSPVPFLKYSAMTRELLTSRNYSLKGVGMHVHGVFVYYEYTTDYMPEARFRAAHANRGSNSSH